MNDIKSREDKGDKRVIFKGFLFGHEKGYVIFWKFGFNNVSVDIGITAYHIDIAVGIIIFPDKTTYISGSMVYFIIFVFGFIKLNGIVITMEFFIVGIKK